MSRFGQSTGSHAIEGIGTLFSVTVFLVFVNGIGVPQLPNVAFLFAVLLYIGGLVTGYGFSMVN